ncbi:MAG: hypothetical protein SGJ13_12110 [Actinomycetota bacterium]|nr:hypothetical protein [Actinomycetota bacterium]
MRTDLGQSIQAAVDAAALVDGGGNPVGDVNGDGYIIVAVARDQFGSPSGSVTQSVLISATYPRPFVLTACSATLRDPIPGDATPTIHIAASATSPSVNVLGRPTTIAVIGLNASRSTNSAAIEVLGTRRYVANSEVSLSGDGYRILGDDNTLHNGEAFDNTDDGVVVVGQGNHLEDVDSYRNGGDGFDVRGGTTAGTANRLQHLVSNNSASGSGGENTGAEYRVLNYIMNVDAPIKADNKNVPEDKCVSFPADSITKNFPVVEVCE